MATVKCQNCGAEMVLPEKSEMVFGTTISEESKENYVLKTKENKTMTKAEQRMEMLRQNGIDTSKYFILNDKVMEVRNSDIRELDKFGFEDRKILMQIFANGYVKNTMLHRRFVLAHMWDMLNFKSYFGYGKGFNDALRAKGYYYQWKVLMDEMRVLGKLQCSDLDAFYQRSHFFNKDVVVSCIADYIKKIREKIARMKTKKCKGIAYVTLRGENIFCSDLNKKLFDKMNDSFRKILSYSNYADIHRELVNFYSKYVKRCRLDWQTDMEKSFVDAYKGAGGYYSLRNLLQFHDCKIEEVNLYGSGTGKWFKGVAALDYIDSKLLDYEGEGYRYFAMMKKCIADNNWTPNWK